MRAWFVLAFKGCDLIANVESFLTQRAMMDCVQGKKDVSILPVETGRDYGYSFCHFAFLRHGLFGHLPREKG